MQIREDRFYHKPSVKRRQEGTQQNRTSFVWSETEPQTPFLTHKTEEITLPSHENIPALLKFSSMQEETKTTTTTNID